MDEREDQQRRSKNELFRQVYTALDLIERCICELTPDPSKGEMTDLVLRLRRRCIEAFAEC